MHHEYMSIANSITSLAINLRFRRTSDINREIIETVTKKSELELAGADEAIKNERRMLIGKW